MPKCNVQYKLWYLISTTLLISVIGNRGGALLYAGEKRDSLQVKHSATEVNEGVNSREAKKEEKEVIPQLPLEKAELPSNNISSNNLETEWTVLPTTKEPTFAPEPKRSEDAKQENKGLKKPEPDFVKEMRQQMRWFANRLKESEDKIEELKETSSKDKNSFTCRLDDLTQRNDKLEKQVKSLAEENTQLKKESAALTSKVSSLVQENDKLKQENNQLKQENNQLKQESKQLKKQLEATKGTNTTLQGQLKRQEKEVQKIEEQQQENQENATDSAIGGFVAGTALGAVVAGALAVGGWFIYKFFFE